MALPQSSVPLSLNDRAAALAEALAAEAEPLRVGVSAGHGGSTLIDCGHRHAGGTEAGLHLARLAMGGLAEVALVPSGQPWPAWGVAVRTSRPTLACLASQYAGWRLEADDGSPLLGSGPARALARAESMFDDIAHKERADRAVLLLEGDQPPGERAIAAVAEACQVTPDRVMLLHARTETLAGMAQIAARAVECAMQKARHLSFPLSLIGEAIGLCPLVAPHPDRVTAMGRANDAIIYGASVHLAVSGPAEAARDLARGLPAITSPDWGRGFAEIYEDAKGDFATIDPGVFSPAVVTVTAMETGESFRAGRADADRLRPATLVA